MTVNISISRLLSIASPVLKYGSLAVLIFYWFLGGVAGLIHGLVTAALFWIIAFLCDTVIELYSEVEKLRSADAPSK